MLLVLLACAAAVSYLLFEQVFTATMTGNTVLLGLAMVHTDRPALVRSGIALAGFLVGNLTRHGTAGGGMAGIYL